MCDTLILNSNFSLAVKHICPAGQGCIIYTKNFLRKNLHFSNYRYMWNMKCIRALGCMSTLVFKKIKLS